MTLEEIKEKYATEKGLNNWNHYRKSYGDMHMEGAMNQIAKRYAAAKLAEAAEKAELKQEGKEGTYKRYYIPFKENPIVVDKESITSIPLD